MYSSTHNKTPQRLHRIRRVIVWLVLFMLVSGATFVVLTKLTPAGRSFVAEVGSRSPQELIRYVKRRLEGHNKLEAVLLAPLNAAQHHFEREPPAGPLPSLGKGQQTVAPDGRLEGITREWRVDSPQAIRQALREARAGTRIVVAPGLYPFNQNLGLGNDGRPGAPVVLGASQPGTVWFQFAQVNGIVVDRPHWVFENLDIRGVCADPGACEHAFHVVGRGAFVTIRNNRITDFNAHIKVNGSRGVWPDHGVLAQTTLTNSAPRSVDAPVVAFDLVGANHWRVQDNLVKDIVHSSAKRTTYGIYMKGASEGGRIERNLVICSSANVSAPGTRVGISWGGGNTGARFCRDGSCSSYEHRQGLAANNIVAHCNDTGFDVNQSTQIVLAHNTVINTSGVATRGSLAQALLYGNLLEGVAKARDGSRLTSELNEVLDHRNAFADTDGLRLEWRRAPEPIPGFQGLQDDFYSRPRDVRSLPGALNR